MSVEEFRNGEAPKVGLSMALHPPKFHSAGAFLRQYSDCPGAIKAMSIFIVFSEAGDAAVFKEALSCIAPEVPEDAYVPVVALLPLKGWPPESSESRGQIIAAYKKWQGVARMMDMKVGAPEYGAMVDSELLMFDNGGDELRGSACGEHGPWTQLYARVRAQDVAKVWPAARVSSTLTQYDFDGETKSGQDYDRTILDDNAQFAFGSGSIQRCETDGCKEVLRQIELCLFSWWTDLPWTRLDHVGNLFAFLAGHQPGTPTGGWRELTRGISFQSFEHVGYQQWTVLHEGFRFRDVTNITGEAKWGSYMEDPLPGANLAQLMPIWISGGALESVEQGILPPLSQEAPPLLIFHADKGRPRAGREQNRDEWELRVLELMRKHERTDWHKGNFRD